MTVNCRGRGRMWKNRFFGCKVMRKRQVYKKVYTTTRCVIDILFHTVHSFHLIVRMYVVHMMSASLSCCKIFQARVLSWAHHATVCQNWTYFKSLVTPVLNAPFVRHISIKTGPVFCKGRVCVIKDDDIIPSTINQPHGSLLHHSVGDWMCWWGQR
jgi:hypothetical protein